ncbi:MAG TPA: sensor histidine kinase [Thermoanaerobaculia bacterium]|nr:sensor histidine kinase [Thermoanaerobaculia bacterium]
MKWLRRSIVANTALLAALGLAAAFGPTPLLPVRHGVGEPNPSLALMHLLAVALAGMALALLWQSRLSLTGELRRLALGLSLANALISLMALFEQIAFKGSPAGWLLVLAPLAMAVVLAWMGKRPLRPAEITAEIEALKIPDEIRQGLLQQIGEAAAQEERNRLARDLHDSIKQQLFSINVGTATAQERWERDPEGARKALADVRRSAREAMVEMQAMLHQLRPEALGTAGLIEALREQCEALGYRTGAEVTLEIGEPIPDDRMPPGAQETLFRIGQEMLANVARHARAQYVRLWLGRQAEEVIMRIEDDGQGFDPAAQVSGMGLKNLKDRANSLQGKLEVASAPGAGAALTVRLPLISPPQAPAAGRQMILSEFLYTIVMAAFCTWPAWGSVDSLSPTAFLSQVIALPILFMITLIGWREGRAQPREAKSFVNRKMEIITGLYIGCWWVSLAKYVPLQPQLFWAIPLAAFLYAAFALAWVHRVSEVRRIWRKGARFWLWLVLPTEAGILVALCLAPLKPRPLALNAAEAFILLAMGIAFPYLVSRQRRVEGATR